MNNYDLSVLIPARNEMFLAETVKNILENIRGNTEIIVVLDGVWANPGVPVHDRVTVVYNSVALGQRAATNQACRLSKAKYVMKIDAHCAVDEGFDLKMIAEMQDDYTMIPLMYNLHGFDWVCIGDYIRDDVQFVIKERLQEKLGCGHRIYQAPTPKACEKCGGNMERELVFKPRLNKKSMYYRFDKTLHFQYWGDYGRRPEAQKDVCEILTIQGSCFMLTREKYWELDVCEEAFGSWGQQGVEVAMKTWLSGGKVLVNKKTWYSHMFRTQGGDFGFPYPLSGSDIDKARKYSRWLLQEGNWGKALPGRDLNWLLDKFWPVPDWHDRENRDICMWCGKIYEQHEDTRPENAAVPKTPCLLLKANFKVREAKDKELRRNIIFYTDNQLRLKYAHAVQKQLKRIGIPIVSASLKPMPTFGQNIHINQPRGMETYFKQIIAVLEASKADIVYMCEHDVLYHPSHFDFIPERNDRFYYNQNFWRIRPEVDTFAVHWDANQVSGLVCYRTLLLDWYKKKWEKIQREGFDRRYEPGGRNSDLVIAWKSEYPNIDIRHGGNLTKSKWSPNDFRDKSTCVNWQEATIATIPGWEQSEILLSFRS